MRTVAASVLATFVAAASAFAQAGGVASISGTVHDPSGSAVPNAKVVVSSASKGEIRSVLTNEAAVFSAPALVPGAGYELTITASGFAPYDLKDISLRVGQNLDLNIGVAVAQTTTEVEVSAAAQLIDDARTDVSQAVGQEQINNLPINGRRVDSFVP